MTSVKICQGHLRFWRKVYVLFHSTLTKNVISQNPCPHFWVKDSVFFKRHFWLNSHYWKLICFFSVSVDRWSMHISGIFHRETKGLTFSRIFSLLIFTFQKLLPVSGVKNKVRQSRRPFIFHQLFIRRTERRPKCATTFSSFSSSAKPTEIPPNLSNHKGWNEMKLRKER